MATTNEPSLHKPSYKAAQSTNQLGHVRGARDLALLHHALRVRKQLDKIRLELPQGLALHALGVQLSPPSPQRKLRAGERQDSFRGLNR